MSAVDTDGGGRSPLLRPSGGPGDVDWGQTTRRGGVGERPYDDFNLAGHVGEVPAVTARNWRCFARASGWRRDEVATAHQVHGDRILTVGTGGPHDVEADAVISLTPGVAVGVFTADCVPLLLAAVESGGPVRGVAAVHCGWRGAAAGLAGLAARRLSTLTGVAPSGMRAWLGASIAACSYEVGGEVAARFAEAHQREAGGGKYWLDVGSAVVADLLGAGVPADRIERCGLDTFAEPDALYSYRRDGARTGRMLSFVGWRQN